MLFLNQLRSGRIEKKAKKNLQDASPGQTKNATSADDGEG
jgi:hypothetical protein